MHRLWVRCPSSFDHTGIANVLVEQALADLVVEHDQQLQGTKANLLITAVKAIYQLSGYSAKDPAFLFEFNGASVKLWLHSTGLYNHGDARMSRYAIFSGPINPEDAMIEAGHMYVVVLRGQLWGPRTKSQGPERGHILAVMVSSDEAEPTDEELFETTFV